MDPFGSSPSQPQSVLSSLIGSDHSSVLNGGQTPASLSNFGLGSSFLFGNQTPASTSGNLLNSLNCPGSNSFFHNSLLSGAGPGSILGGPGSVLNSLNGPSSVLSGFDRGGGPASILNFSGLSNVPHYTEPASVLNNNLAVPMTPLVGADSAAALVALASNLKTPGTPLSVAIADIPSPTLQNIVSTVNLGVALDLKKIALRARNAEYNPKRFAAVIMRIREPRTTALIFSSGKMVCTGAKSEETSRLAARKYARIVQKLGFDAKFTEFKVQNMVGSCDVRFPIQLEGLFITHSQFSTYEPELFPGLIYRMVKPRVVLLIFVSGKVVITGAKYKRDIDEAFNQIYPILKGFKK